MAKWDPLRDWLAIETGLNYVTLTFDKIDQLVGGLPPSARNTREWWGTNHTQGAAWRAAGRKIHEVDLEKQTVTFLRVVTLEEWQRHNEAGAERRASTAEVRIRIVWWKEWSVTLDQSGDLLLATTRSGAGLYRFNLRGRSGDRSFVGQSVNVNQSILRFGWSGQSQLLRRLHQEMVSVLEGGGEVGLTVALSDDVKIDTGSGEDAVDLSDKDVRELVLRSAVMAIPKEERLNP